MVDPPILLFNHHFETRCLEQNKVSLTLIRKIPDYSSRKRQATK